MHIATTGRRKEARAHPLCLKKEKKKERGLKKMLSNGEKQQLLQSAPQPPSPAVIITTNIAIMGLYILTLSTHTRSYLIFGVAEQLLPGLHEADCDDRARVATEGTHWL